ncbi:MAG: glycoside hydrolase family 2 TIM barrel-domain containing protein, partial [Armatimonadota bacterium]|nr:glycoside hydrolase family 2 TIM barrel-domain containing protein [Armatimonadota bacterium]
MRNLWPVAFCVMALAHPAAGAVPPFVALPGVGEVTVRLTDAASAGVVRYQIREWPAGERLADGEAHPQTDASGLPSFRVGGLHPRPWSLQDPRLYELVLTRADGAPLGKTRFGFRTFEVKERRFLLNGRPLFLRGLPINPPGRDLPEATGNDPAFIRAYLRLLKGAGVNLVRTQTHEWLDACDEVGMLVFLGRYGASPGGKPDAPPSFERARPAYRELFLDLANHPSVVIYVLTNEVSYSSTGYRQFLARVREDIRLLDPTRPVIGNAGFGRGEPGEIYDLHPYWGWYSGNPCDWYRLEQELRKADAAGKPLTLSECVGAYTTDSGEFMTQSKQMATHLRWL